MSYTSEKVAAGVQNTHLGSPPFVTPNWCTRLLLLLADICRLCPLTVHILKGGLFVMLRTMAKVKINKSRVATNSAFMPRII